MTWVHVLLLIEQKSATVCQKKLKVLRKSIYFDEKIWFCSKIASIHGRVMNSLEHTWWKLTFVDTNFSYETPIFEHGQSNVVEYFCTRFWNLVDDGKYSVLYLVRITNDAIIAIIRRKQSKATRKMRVASFSAPRVCSVLEEDLNRLILSKNSCIWCQRWGPIFVKFLCNSFALTTAITWKCF